MVDEEVSINLYLSYSEKIYCGQSIEMGIKLYFYDKRTKKKILSYYTANPNCLQLKHLMSIFHVPN